MFPSALIFPSAGETIDLGDVEIILASELSSRIKNSFNEANQQVWIFLLPEY